MAWIGAVIQGAASLYGAYKNSQANKKQNSLIDAQVGASKQLGAIGTDLVGQGSALGAPATRRLLSLAAGNRGEVWNAIAPEAADINARSNEVQRTSAELTPRGGGRAAVLAAEPYRKADAINRLFMSARRDANDTLLQLSAQKTQQGLGAIGGSLGGLQGATTGSIKTRESQATADAQVGANLADAWQQFYKWYSTRGTSSADAPA